MTLGWRGEIQPQLLETLPRSEGNKRDGSCHLRSDACGGLAHNARVNCHEVCICAIANVAAGKENSVTHAESHRLGTTSCNHSRSIPAQDFWRARWEPCMSRVQIAELCVHGIHSGSFHTNKNVFGSQLWSWKFQCLNRIRATTLPDAKSLHCLLGTDLLCKLLLGGNDCSCEQCWCWSRRNLLLSRCNGLALTSTHDREGI